MLSLAEILRSLRLSVIAPYSLRFLGSTLPRTLAPSGKHIVDHILLDIVPQYMPLDLTLLLYPFAADQTSVLFVPCWADHLEECQVQEDQRVGPEPLSESADRRLVDSQRPANSGSRPLVSECPENESLLIGGEPGMVIVGSPRRPSVAEDLTQGRLRHEVFPRSFEPWWAFANCPVIVREVSGDVKMMGSGFPAIVDTVARRGE